MQDPKTIGRSGRRVVVTNTSVKGGVKWAGDPGGGGGGAGSGGDDKGTGRKEATLPHSPNNEKQDGAGSDDGRKSDEGERDSGREAGPKLGRGVLLAWCRRTHACRLGCGSP